MTPLRGTCERCKWFASQTSMVTGVRYTAPLGECRRYAPRGPFPFHVTKRNSVAIVSAFAVVPIDDWCGEFERGEE